MIKLSNLGTRVLVALFGIPLILFVCIAGKFPFLFFVTAIGAVSFYEYSKMISRRKFFPNRIIGGLSVILVILNSYSHFIDFQTLYLIIIPLVLLAELFRKRESPVINIGTTLTGIFYIGLFAGALVSIREIYSDTYFLYDQGGYLVISILASIWICDSAAYFIGSAIGSHKILPRISPHKSWEGSIAGFVLAIVTMLVAKFAALHFISTQDALAIGVIIGTVGQVGDFVESMIKRDANVKDSSSLIPGHGGIFDRFDSLLFSAPVIYLYLKFFVDNQI